MSWGSDSGPLEAMGAALAGTKQSILAWCCSDALEKHQDFGGKGPPGISPGESQPETRLHPSVPVAPPDWGCPVAGQCARGTAALDWSWLQKVKIRHVLNAVSWCNTNAYHCTSPSDTSCCWRAAPLAAAGWHFPGRRATGDTNPQTCWPHTCPARRWPRSHSRPKWIRMRRPARSRRCCAPGGGCPRCHGEGRCPWWGVLPARQSNKQRESFYSDCRRYF